MIGWWVTGGLLVGFFLGCAYVGWVQASFGRRFLADAAAEAEQLREIMRAPGLDGIEECALCPPAFHELGVHAPGVRGTTPCWPDGSPFVPRQRGHR